MDQTLTAARASGVVVETAIVVIGGGHGPSASTIGANRAGRAAAGELIETLGLA